MPNTTPNRSSLLIAALVVLGAVGQVLAGFAPDILGWTDTIATRSTQYNVLLIPGGWAFLIWLPLFVGAIAFSIFGLLRAQRSNLVYRRVAILAGCAYWINTLRSLYEPWYGPNWVSFLLLLGILIPLLVASMVAVQARGKLAYIPVYAQAGWIAVATAAGFNQTLKFEGVSLLAFHPLTLAIATLLAATPILATVSARLGSVAFTGAAAWGLAWIGVVNQQRELYALSSLAYGVAAVITLATVIGIRSANHRENQHKVC